MLGLPIFIILFVVLIGSLFLIPLEAWIVFALLVAIIFLILKSNVKI